MKFLIAIVLSVIAVAGFLLGMFFIGVFSVLIPLACYYIVYKKYREYFWKSFVIGIVIGFPIGFYAGFSYIGWHYSSPEYQERAMDEFQANFPVSDTLTMNNNSYCLDDRITLFVTSPSTVMIKEDEIEVEYIKGSCERHNMLMNEIGTGASRVGIIFFEGCSKGANTIRIISPAGEDQITIDC